MKRFMMLFVMCVAASAAMAQRQSVEKALERSFAMADQQEVLEAVKANNLQEAKRLLQGKFAVAMVNGADSRENQFRTPLMYAAQNANAEMVKLLVEKGADVSAKDSKRQKVLMYAITSDKGSEHEQAEIVGLLMKKGAKIEGQEEWKEVFKQGKREVFGVLLRAGDVRNNMRNHKYAYVLYDLISTAKNDAHLPLIEEYFNLYAAQTKMDPKNLLVMPPPHNPQVELKDYLPHSNPKTEAYFRKFLPDYRTQAYYDRQKEREQLQKESRRLGTVVR